MRTLYCILIGFCLLLLSEVKAQLIISGQLRTRTELRAGQGSPSVSDTVPALFTSQRTRLSLGYTGYRFKLFTSLQDVRVWGQDASTINRVTTDAFDGVMVHEAWGEISLLDTGNVVSNLTLKIGRQELVYDDVRLLGNLDWLQQARRHDAAVLKFDHQGYTVHLGGAFNQNGERKASTIYNGIPGGYIAGTNGIGTLYKSMQFLYVAKKTDHATVSLLAFKDDFSKFHFAAADPEKKTPIFEGKVWSRFTIGTHYTATVLKSLSLTGDAVYQGGHYREGTTLNEYFLSFSALYASTAKLSIGPGIDITSGNNGTDPSKRYQRFDPLYGTPHKFWGYMDYFYVADGFGANGLIDVYLKSRYKPRENLLLTMDVHHFSLPQAVTDEAGLLLRKRLGLEMDIIASYALTKVITFEGGYSWMSSTSTMISEKVKNVKNADQLSQWAYLMISIRPEVVIGKKG